MQGKESKYEMNQKMMINMIADGINQKQNHDSPLQHFSIKLVKDTVRKLERLGGK